MVQIFRSYTCEGGVIESPRPGNSYNGLYGEAPPESGTFYRVQIYERVGVWLVEVSREICYFGLIKALKGLTDQRPNHQVTQLPDNSNIRYIHREVRDTEFKHNSITTCGRDKVVGDVSPFLVSRSWLLKQDPNATRWHVRSWTAFLPER